MNDEKTSSGIKQAAVTLLILTAAFCGFFWFGYLTAERTSEEATSTREASLPGLTPTSPEIPRLRTL